MPSGGAAGDEPRTFAMNIRWMPLAEQDLAAAYEYIGQDNPKAASRLVTRVFQAIEMLSRYPSAGHPGRVPATRELSIAHTPYIVVYRPTRNEIQVLSVIHGARRWPMSFDESG
ncbi:MAG TPA: type II toxin-antitoxin system RelE/ParE family toxin [Terriglobia bacterium]|nr:type II toxin-antitoxin system RelE/ParE family toxin [Terriglobia bacterium]